MDKLNIEELHKDANKKKMQLPKVSVLVAVYNAEKYLRKCVETLTRQTYKNLQIICVDDCSTDHSVEMLKGYAEIDERIEIVQLEQNHGQAHARNKGLEVADGELITFCDSDDYMEADAIEKTVDVFLKHPETDCVLFRVINWYPETGQKEDYPMPFFEKLTGREAFDRSIDNWKIHGWYMTRTKLHKQYPYDETCRWYSDDNVTHVHYFHSKEVRCGAGIYNYRQNPESVTHCASISRFDWMKANTSMKRQLSELGVDETTVNIYENVRWRVLIDSYMYWFQYRSQFNRQERRYGLSEIRKTWESMETHRIDERLKHKFGYFPFRHSWLFFRLQEEIYFTIKRILGKL